MIPARHTVMVGWLLVSIAVCLPQAGNAAGTAIDTSTLFPYAEFIIQRLLRPVEVNGLRFGGLTETENALDGDEWMWTDDNAKSLELLFLPGVYERHQPAVNSVLDFCLEMMKDDFILRRITGDPADANVGRFRFEQVDPNDFRFHSGLMTYHGGANGISQGFRFHDGRDKDALKHSLGAMEFTFADGEVEVYNPMMDVLFNQTLSTSPDAVTITMVGELKRKGKAFATVNSTFVVSADRPTTERIVRVSPPAGSSGPTFRTVSFSLECESGMGVTDQDNDMTHFDHWCFPKPQERGDGVKIKCDTTVLPKNKVKLLNQLAWERTNGDEIPPWIAAAHLGDAGFSYASYYFPVNSTNLKKITYDAKRYAWDSPTTSSAFVRLGTHYTCDQLVGNQPCTIIERKLLTAGGLHDELERYHAVLTRLSAGQDQGMIDYSISYDIGAELNGLSTFYLFAHAQLYKYKAAVSPERLENVKATIDRHVRVYYSVFARRTPEGVLINVFVRGLAYLILSLNNMYAVTGDSYYADRLAEGIAMLLDMLRKDEPRFFRCFGKAGHSAIDCHTSGLLAISRVVATYPFTSRPHAGLQLAPLVDVLQRNGIRRFIRHSQKDGTPQWAVDGELARDFEWGFACGLTLRALHSIELASKRYSSSQAADPFTFTLSASDTETLKALTKDCADYLDASTKVYEGTSGDAEGGGGEPFMKEIKTSRFSFETNTETQPWTTLGRHSDVGEGVIHATLRELYAKDSRSPRARSVASRPLVLMSPTILFVAIAFAGVCCVMMKSSRRLRSHKSRAA